MVANVGDVAPVVIEGDRFGPVELRRPLAFAAEAVERRPVRIEDAHLSVAKVRAVDASERVDRDAGRDPEAKGPKTQVPSGHGRGLAVREVLQPVVVCIGDPEGAVRREGEVVG